MDKQQLMMQIRRKKLGLLVTDARIASHRTQADCARVLGVDLDTYCAYEKGELAPSLPQIESLACFLNVTMQHFWGKESLSADGIWEEAKIQQRQSIRDRFIGTRLRQARNENGISIQEAAEKAGLDVETLQAYELGRHSIPLPVLEVLGTFYPLDINELFDARGFVGEWHAEKEALQMIKDLPEPVREFIRKPVNYPYIELAIQLSEMPAEKLRTIAESLLEITF